MFAVCLHLQIKDESSIDVLRSIFDNEKLIYEHFLHQAQNDDFISFFKQQAALGI